VLNRAPHTDWEKARVQGSAVLPRPAAT